MKIQNKAQLLAVVSWSSVFTEAWLLILRLIEPDAISWGFFILFFIVAFVASIPESR